VTPDGRRDTESAILVAVPEAEPAVSRLRNSLDPSAPLGVPAHVTALYPFVAPDEITDAVLDAARAAVASVPGFGCRFARTGWFGENVVWLAPEPDDPFRALTAALSTAFPDCPPYGGKIAAVIPHLTIGDRPSGGVSALRAAEAEVLPFLPVSTQVSDAWLMCGSQQPRSWHVVARLPLGD
jgi:2'-5' RNA ligase